MEENFKKRIKFDRDIKEISIRVCRNYDLGEFKANSIILTGYEDFNYILETSKGKFLVKVFASIRNDEDCKRYIEVIEEGIKAGISTPRLIKTDHGEYLDKINIDDFRLRLVLLEFIKGNTFYEYNKKYKYLPEEDLVLIKPLISKFEELNIERLPHCFVHGDIISTNVIKAKNKLWIIDFAVSNYYPRIQELAVLSCNLFFDEESKKNSTENLKIALKEYQEIVSLTQNEIKALPTYIELAHGMHLLSAN